MNIKKLLLLLPLGIFAATDGLPFMTGYAGYQLTTSVASMGRGGAGVATADDGAYSHMNPAGIYNSESDRFYLSHSNLFRESRSEFLNASLKYKQPVGISLFYRFLGEAPHLTDGANYDENNIYSAYDAALTLTSGYKFSKMDIGYSLKVMHSEIGYYGSTAVAADFGVICKTAITGLDAGVSVLNLGYATAYEKTAIPLTVVMRAGTAYSRKLENGLKLRLLTDIQAASNGTFSIPAGIEAGSRWLTLRGGWNILHDTQTFSAGLSIKLSSIQFDYTYANFTENLSDNSIPQLFSLSVFLN
ncbi:MAG: hypothetical protein JNL74_00035 [Fibrobacteres bacterium]|nr:hypothetical protein [Fibrobacterota bacterium]